MSTQITTQKVLAFDSFANFPLTGLEGYIYIDNSANIGYLWDEVANQYVNIGGVDTPVSQDPIPLTFANAATNGVLSPTPNYNNGTLGVGATLIGSTNGALTDGTSAGKIDSTYTPVVGDIILVKNQTVSANPTLNKAFQNGLYVINDVGSVSAPYQLTRVVDFDTSTELYPLQINILSGNNNALKYFIQTTVNPVIGTSNLIFSISSAQSIVSQISFVDTVIDTALSNITYANGTVITSIPGNGATLTSTVNGALGTWNGLTANTNSSVANSFTKVLVINQTNPAHNGDYQVINAGSASTPWKLVRINTTASGFNRYTRYFVVSNTGSTKAGKVYFTTPNATPLTNATIGTAAINIVEYGGSSTGPFGIANSSGVYTYYSTLTLAMTAAASLTNAVVEVFANYTETGNITITIPNSVTIQGNGYTYTNTNSSVQTLFTNANNANCNIYNYNIAYAGTSNTGRCVLVSLGTIDLLGTIISIIDNAGTSGAYCVQISGSAATVRNGTAIANGGANGFINQGGTLINPIARTVNGNAVYNVSGNCYNALGITSGTGIGAIGINFYKATGIASGNARGASLLGNCHDVQGFSQSNVGVYIDSGTYTNITGISNGSVGVQNQNDNCIVNNLRAVSAVSNGFFTQNKSGIIINGGIIESAGAIVVSCESQVSFNNVYIKSTWNSVNGHGLRVINVDTIELVNCTIEVFNASANCLWASNARTLKYVGNKWKVATTPINVNVTQSLINTQDNQGNILIA